MQIILTPNMPSAYVCMHMEELAERIKAWMDWAKVSQGDIERMTGLSQSHLSVFLSGKKTKKAHPKTLRLIAESLGIHPSDLDRWPPKPGEPLHSPQRREPFDLNEWLSSANPTVDGVPVPENYKGIILEIARAIKNEGKKKGDS